MGSGVAHSRILVAAAPAVALAVALVASCNEGTEPTLGVTVAETFMTGPSYSSDSAGEQLIECEITLRAQNASSRDATWKEATFAFYAPNDPQPFGVDTIPAATVGSSWGATVIGPHATESATWMLTASVPFTLRMQFFYQAAVGAVGSSGVSVSCKPNAPAGPAPTITLLQDHGDTAPEPGDTLHFNYAATSSVGLWQSVFQVTGPCETAVLLPEHPQVAVTHDVALPLPAACSLGTAVKVTAESFDDRLQEATRSLTLPALVDHRAPRVSALVSTSWTDWFPIDRFAGFAFTGDAMSFIVTAIDNHALRRVYWELLPVGLRDSMVVSDSALTQTITIPVQSGWVGAMQLRLSARDASGNISDTIASRPDAIQVGPTVGSAPTLTGILGDIEDVAFDTRRAVIYLLQSNPSDIAVFSPASLTLARTIALPDYAPAFDLSPGGDSIITVLMNSHALGIIDLTQASLGLTMVPLSPQLDSTYRLLNVRVASSGQVLIATQHVEGGEKRLYTYDLASGTLRVRLDAPDYGNASGGPMERSVDGKVIIVNGTTGAFLRYDAVTDAFTPGQTARIQDTRPSVDSTGTHVAVSGDLYDAALQYVRTVGIGLSVEGPATISPNGQTHYMAIAGIVRSRVSDGSLIDHIPAALPIHLVRVSPDGSILAVVRNLGSESKIGLINLAQLH